MLRPLLSWHRASISGDEITMTAGVSCSAIHSLKSMLPLPDFIPPGRSMCKRCLVHALALYTIIYEYMHFARCVRRWKRCAMDLIC